MLHNVVTLKSTLGVTSLSSKMTPFDGSHTIYNSSSIVTIAMLYRFRNKARYSGRKTPIFHTPFHLAYWHDQVEPL